MMNMLRCCLLVAVIAGCGTREAPPSLADEHEGPGNKLYMTPNDVHALLLDETAEAFEQGTHSGTIVVSDPSGVTLETEPSNGEPARPPFKGVHTSRVIAAAFPFNDVVPSWNVDCPLGAGFVVELRFGRAEGDFWTPFYYLGTWGTAEMPAVKIQHDRNGDVDTDYFRSIHRFDRLQYRIHLYSPRRGPLPVLRRIGLAYSNTL
ncbi:MAG TPA: hypothetical protein P5316_21635, partial [Phycisphaerae bacterium]|nr:hypothetical protein [Phycisphaerae bacterium]